MVQRRNLRPSFHRILILLCLCGFAPTSSAEELVLKSGEKIVGTIVGFENNMFRVETPFGFALVRKDRVVSVNFPSGATSSAEPSGTETKSGDPRTSSSAVKSDRATGHASQDSKARTEAVAAPPRPAPPRPAPPRPAPPAVSRPLNDPLPANIEERVEGASYVNKTFRFAM